MLVKIENLIYDSNDIPIMIVVDDFDKECLSNMGDRTKYCSFPRGTKVEEIENFMEVE